MENQEKSDVLRGEDKFKFKFKIQRSIPKPIKKKEIKSSVTSCPSKKPNILSLEYFKGVYADYLIEQLLKPDHLIFTSSNAVSYPSAHNM